MRVYTAIYGGYDPLRPHPDHPGVDEWVCYTDDPTLEMEGWRVVVEAPKYPHPRLAAKWRKCHPPAGNTLWIDGSVWIQNTDIIEAALDNLGWAEMTMFAHPNRDCIFPEVEASVGMAKYAGLEDAMRRQVNHYRANGWKENAGLWASTVIGRRDVKNVREFGAAWFAHCETFSYQDQLSLPYLLDRYGVRVAPLPYSLTNNPWFLWCGHNSDA